jgi:7-keto-8-aminopelargonate synthetase-like enzyme
MSSQARAPLAFPLQQVERTCVIYGRRRKLAYFGGCDYFRLSTHPRVISAVSEGLVKYGLNVAASRFTTGNHRLYEVLEAKLAQFFEVEQALVTSSGYAANLVAAQALAGEFTHLLMDERAHASLVDATCFLQSPVLKFAHCEPAKLAGALQDLGHDARPLVVTDGLFAQDGALAPLPEYLGILPAGGSILVDDAHGAGVLGQKGRGTVEHLNAQSDRLFLTATLSKAFGTYGGVILGARDFIQKALRRSRLFPGNTPLPLPLVAAALAALDVLQTDQAMRARLRHNTACVKAALRSAGFPVVDNPSPIVSLVPQDAPGATQLSKRLLARGIYPCLIRYPGGPPQGSFRFALSSEHTPAQLEGLIEALTPKCT